MADDGTQDVTLPFPDLKGQAPLRPFVATPSVTCSQLFLTSKVRLHCDAN